MVQCNYQTIQELIRRTNNILDNLLFAATEKIYNEVGEFSEFANDEELKLSSAPIIEDITDIADITEEGIFVHPFLYSYTRICLKWEYYNTNMSDEEIVEDLTEALLAIFMKRQKNRYDADYKMFRMLKSRYGWS